MRYRVLARGQSDIAEKESPRRTRHPDNRHPTPNPPQLRLRVPLSVLSFVTVRTPRFSTQSGANVCRTKDSKIRPIVFIDRSTLPSPVSFHLFHSRVFRPFVRFRGQLSRIEAPSRAFIYFHLTRIIRSTRRNREQSDRRKIKKKEKEKK